MAEFDQETLRRLRRDINAADAPGPAGQYTQAVEVAGASRALYLSGQVGIALDGASPKTPRRNARWRGGICRRNCALPVWRSKIW
jgi:hypothetical protein